MDLERLCHDLAFVRDCLGVALDDFSDPEQEWDSETPNIMYDVMSRTRRRLNRLVTWADELRLERAKEEAGLSAPPGLPGESRGLSLL